MATIYTLTIDPVALGITKPVDKVYIKNLYVDTDDTHIRTAPFEYGANVIGELSFVELPPTTLGSIYQIQLFGTEGMVLSVFFGMPERDTYLSELDIYTAYPPRTFYPGATISWGQIKGAIANQLDLSTVMFTKSNATTLQGVIDAKNLLQDNAINLKASISDVNTKNGLQDAAINDLRIKDVSQDSAIELKASIAYVDDKNLLQDSAISDLQSKDLEQDNEIALRSTITSVDAKNLLQDTAINNLQNTTVAHESAIALKANTSDVDAKNLLQDNAIGANTANIVAIQAYAPQNRTIAATGDATWSVTFDGSKNVSGVMTVKKGSTTQAGLLKLNNAINSSSTTESATPSAVKTAYDLAASAIPAAQKGAINGVATLGADGKIPADQFRASATVLWGSITGNISEQIDLTSLFYSKASVDSAISAVNTTATAAKNTADAAIPNAQKGAINGVATLGADGKVLPTQLPVNVPVAWGNITGDIAAQTDLSARHYTKSEVDTQLSYFGDLVYFYAKHGDFHDITTTEPPNVVIEPDGSMKRSTAATATLGTAATKDVGLAAGNVMEVGAFGLGSASAPIISSSERRPLGFGAFLEISEGDNSGSPHYQMALNLGWVDNTHGLQLLAGLSNNKSLGFRHWINATQKWGAYQTIRTSINTTKDANGFLRDSNSTAETVVADATGSVAVNSIQAGIGAPKIAYKKFFLPSGTPTVAHGLNRGKILDISGVYVNDVERYPYTNAKVNATILDATQNSTTERHILITYEVD